MAKFTINKRVKYGGKLIEPNTVFGVKPEHVDEIKALGGHLVEQSAEGGIDEEPGIDEEQELSHEAIVARAEELGIEVGRKSDKTLMKLIREAELEE